MKLGRRIIFIIIIFILLNTSKIFSYTIEELPLKDDGSGLPTDYGTITQYPLTVGQTQIIHAPNMHMAGAYDYEPSDNLEWFVAGDVDAILVQGHSDPEENSQVREDSNSRVGDLIHIYKGKGPVTIKAQTEGTVYLFFENYFEDAVTGGNNPFDQFMGEYILNFTQETIGYKIIVSNNSGGSTTPDTPTTPTLPNDAINSVNEYKPTEIDNTSANTIETMTGKILTAVTNVGIIITVIIIAVIGTKYMLGSVEEKAEYKRDLVPYMVGAMMLFGILAIMKALMAFGEKISSI